MTISSRQSALAAASTFHAICERNGISSDGRRVRAAWEAFQEFCEIPLERNLEGAQFEFRQAKFELPDGPFYLSFTRYWYYDGEEPDIPHVAQFAIKYAFEVELVRLSFELETNSNASDTAVDLETSRAFIAKVESRADLWSALNVRQPISFDCYVGPQ